MPNKNLYLAADDEKYWDEVAAIAKRRKTSMSKLMATLLRNFVHENDIADREGMGLPVGVPIPKSLMPPEVVARERLADDIRSMVLERLQGADLS